MNGCKKEEPGGYFGPPATHPLVVFDVKVTTGPVTGITGFSAFGGGVVIEKSVPTLVDFNDIEWNTRSDFGGWNSSGVSPYDFKGDSFSCFIVGLSPQTTYYIRARSFHNIQNTRGLLDQLGTTYGDTISFTTDSLRLGMVANSGIVFYIDSTGEHGLIASLTDLPDLAWVVQGFNKGTGAISTTDGIGNTVKIDSVYYPYPSPAGDYAARVCYKLIVPGWNYYGSTPWFLPAKDQLEKMYLKKDLIGGFLNKPYWSSTEADPDNAFAQDFSNGSQSALDKTKSYGVRAIRQF